MFDKIPGVEAQKRPVFRFLAILTARRRRRSAGARSTFHWSATPKIRKLPQLTKTLGVLKTNKTPKIRKSRKLTKPLGVLKINKTPKIRKTRKLTKPLGVLKTNKTPKIRKSPKLTKPLGALKANKTPKLTPVGAFSEVGAAFGVPILPVRTVLRSSSCSS